MAISRRLRFEILKRDGYKCKYCGATAEDAQLTVDHVIPQALGGTDDPSNLCCACRPCNSGKSAVSPDDEHVAQVAADAARWGEAIKVATAMRQERRDEEESYVDTFDAIWCQWFQLRKTSGRQWCEDSDVMPDGSGRGSLVDRPGYWEKSVRGLYQRGVPIELVEYAVGVAMRKIGCDDPFQYMLGVCRVEGDRVSSLARMILDGHEEAARAITDPTIDWNQPRYGSQSFARCVKNAQQAVGEAQEKLRQEARAAPPMSPERLTEIGWTPDPEYWRARGEHEDTPGAQWRSEVRDRLLSINRLAAEFYADQIRRPGEAGVARTWLAERGFDQPAAELFGCGFATSERSDLTTHLHAQGFSTRELERAGVSVKGQTGHRDRFTGRLVWPVRDAGGDVTSFAAARLFKDDPVEAPYIYGPASPIFNPAHTLFGVGGVKQATAPGSIGVLVPSILDVMAMEVASVTPTFTTTTLDGRLNMTHFDRLERAGMRLTAFIDGDDNLLPYEVRQRHGDGALQELVVRAIQDARAAA